MAKELLDIATRHASGEEAIRAVFTLAEVGAAAGGGWTTPPSFTVRGTKKGAKGGKMGQKCRPCRLTMTTNHSNIGKEIKNSVEEFRAAASVISSGAPDHPKTTWRRFLKPAVLTTHTPSSKNSMTVPWWGDSCPQ
jgi:hypothetical protein